MHKLRHSRGAGRADIGGLVTKSVEHFFVFVENFLVAADPNRQLAGLSTLGPTAHWRIKTIGALGRECFRHALHQRLGIGGKVEIRRALLHTSQNAIGAKNHRLHFLGSR